MLAAARLLTAVLVLGAGHAAAGEVAYLRTIEAGARGSELFQAVNGIYADRSGVYLADGPGGRLVVVGEQGNRSHVIEGKQKLFGSRELGGVARLGDTHWAVANPDSNQIVVLNNDGSTSHHIGESGRLEGQLDRPLGLASSGRGRLYVADSGNNRISVFSREGMYLFSFGTAGGAERLERPGDVAVDDRERVYVLETGNDGRLSVFDHNGILQKQISARTLAYADNKPKFSAMSVNALGQVWLADSNNGKLVLLDWQSGKTGMVFGSKGAGRGQFSAITAVTVTSDQQLLVGDTGNRKVEIYQLPAQAMTTVSPLDDLRLAGIRRGPVFAAGCDHAIPLHDGHLLCLRAAAKAVTSVSADGKSESRLAADFRKPVAAATDENDIAVIDHEQIKVFSPKGVLRFAIGRSGSGDGEFDSPSGVFLGDRIYVADSGNRRVQIFSRDGIYLDKLVNEKGKPEILRKPVALVVDTQRNMYIADNGTNSIHVYSDRHEFLFDIGADGKSPGRFEKIHSLAIDKDDNLYVLASTAANKQLVQVYSGPRLVFSFGSGMQTSPGFDNPVSLSLLPSDKTTLAVYDAGRKGLQTFYYEQVPSRVGGVTVSGGVDRTQVRWQKTPAVNVGRYAVYGAAAAVGSYRKLGETGGNSITLTRDEVKDSLYFRVAAISNYRVEGVASQPREDLFAAGYQQYRQNRMEAAAGLFARAVAEDGNNAEALEFLGRALLAQSKYDDALRAFGDLAKLDSHRVNGINLQVEGMIQSGQFLLARSTLDQAMATRNVDARTYFLCGQVGLQLGDAAGAAACLEKSLKLDEKNVAAHFLLGQAYIRMGVIARGLAEFDASVNLAPQNAEVWLHAGEAYQSLGRNDEALVRFNKALSIDGLDPAARLGAARSHVALKEYDKARGIALSMSGNPAQEGAGQYLLGIIALATGQPQEAVLALARAGSRDPGNAGIWLALAEAQEKAGNRDKIREALRRAIGANPDSFDANFRLGQMDVADGNLNDAAGHLARAAALHPADYETQLVYGRTLLALERYKEASDRGRSALKLEPKKAEPLLLLADSAHAQGKNGDAIEYLKKALTLNAGLPGLHLKLGQRYLENNMHDPALVHLDKAVALEPRNPLPHVLLGQMYLERRLFDAAIRELNRAAELDPGADSKALLNSAYAEKKRSLEFSQGAPRILLQDLRLNRVFSAAYKQYEKEPVGQVSVKNSAGVDYTNLRLTFYIKGYMDFPSARDIPSLKAGEAVTFPLHASFNNRILGIDEDTGVQAEIKLAFAREGQQNFSDITHPMTIYGKNAILWADPSMVGSFVTPKDDVLRDFVRQTVTRYLPVSNLNENVVKAMTLFDSLSAHGIRYLADPNSPYSQINAEQVDYVQFPRETLRVKSGDCDDLSVLLSAGFENLGIETALVDVPGHLFLMFNTRVAEKNKDIISLQDDLLVIRDGEVWLPLESTMIASSFSEGWAEGAKKYHAADKAGTLKLIPLKLAWTRNMPVTLAPANYAIEIPPIDKVGPLIDRERRILVTKSLDRQILPYRTMLLSNPADQTARLQIAIIYAQNGLHDQAFSEFDRLLELNPKNSDAHNNRGNIYYTLGEYDRALDAYLYAEELDPADGGIKMNLALTHYKRGRLKEAAEKYREAVSVNKGLANDYRSFEKLLVN